MHGGGMHGFVFTWPLHNFARANGTWVFSIRKTGHTLYKWGKPKGCLAEARREKYRSEEQMPVRE